jgi:hypothetical protein
MLMIQINIFYEDTKCRYDVWVFKIPSWIIFSDESSSQCEQKDATDEACNKLSANVIQECV